MCARYRRKVAFSMMKASPASFVDLNPLKLEFLVISCSFASVYSGVHPYSEIISPVVLGRILFFFLGSLISLSVQFLARFCLILSRMWEKLSFEVKNFWSKNSLLEVRHLLASKSPAYWRMEPLRKIFEGFYSMSVLRMSLFPSLRKYS